MANPRIPPHSADAESSVIGALLLDKDAIIAVAESLNASHFYDQRHKEIYEAIIELYEDRIPIDVLTVSDRLKKRKTLKNVGGSAYLAQLVNGVPTAAHVEHYGKIVRDLATKRSLMSAAARLVELSLDDALAAEELLDKAEGEVFSLTQKALSQSFVHIKTALADAFDRLDELHKQGGNVRGVPTGYADLDNLLAGMQRSNLIILAARPGVGKCVVGDSLIVNTKTGARQTIESIVSQKIGSVLTLNSDFTFEKSKPSDFVYDGFKPVYELTTQLGNSLEATAIHPLLTIQGWKRLEEIKVGDRIAVPNKINVFGIKEWESWRVKSAAYFLGDGGTTTASPKFTNGNTVIMADFCNSVKKFGGVDVIFAKQNMIRFSTPIATVVKTDPYQRDLRGAFSFKVKEWIAQMGWNKRRLALALDVSPSLVDMWCSASCLPGEYTNQKLEGLIGTTAAKVDKTNPVTQWLSSVGIMGKLAIHKEIPAEIFELNKNNVSLFLNRLYSCEGSIILPKTKGSGRISFSSSSLKLAEGVKHLLLRFGILGRLRTKRIKYKNEVRIAYELEIMGAYNILKFVDQIGIYGKQKQINKIRALAESKKESRNWSKDTLPLGVWKIINEEKGNMSWTQLYKKMGMPLSHNIHVNKRQLRRDTLKRIAIALKSDRLLALAESEVYWDKVIAVSYAGVKQVYDLTINKSHNFVANDIVVHNTSLALNILQHVTVNLKRPAAMFSLEMSNEELIDRLLVSQADIDAWRLKTGKLSEDDFSALSNAMGELAEAPIYIDDTPGLSILEMRTKARRLQVEHGIELLVVDYLQLAKSRNLENRVQEVSEISQGLKNIARELKIPVIALSQLSRSVEQRGTKRPQLSDLRDSGCLLGSTLITMAESGKRVSIQSLVGKKDVSVLALDENMKLIPAKVSNIFPSGKKLVYKLTLKSGKSIVASGNHPFLKINGWERLDKLEVSDKIATVRISKTEVNQDNSDVYWDEIISIEPVGKEEVYDATVPSLANFVANDIIVHNSIEQDADVVMFLFREDDENPENMTLDISKHRNGPLGSVKFFFKGDRIRFYGMEHKRGK